MRRSDLPQLDARAGGSDCRVLALAGGYMVVGNWVSFSTGTISERRCWWACWPLPLAPVAKDLSTALATAVNTMQLVKKP